MLDFIHIFTSTRPCTTSYRITFFRVIHVQCESWQCSRIQSAVLQPSSTLIDTSVSLTSSSQDPHLHPFMSPSPAIVFAPGAVLTHIGLSTESTPRVILSSTDLPLRPSLTLATRLVNLLYVHLSLTPSTLTTHRLIIAEPPLALSRTMRSSITHAATLLGLSSPLFLPTTHVISAALAVARPLVLHIGVHAVAVVSPTGDSLALSGGLHAVDEKLAKHMAIPISDATAVRAAVAVAPPPGTPVAMAKVVMDNGREISVDASRATVWDHLVEQAATIVLQFLHDVRDMYERVRLSRTVALVTDECIPCGLGRRVEEEVIRLCEREHTMKKVKVCVVETPYDASVLLWVGAALLSEQDVVEDVQSVESVAKVAEVCASAGA